MADFESNLAGIWGGVNITEKISMAVEAVDRRLIMPDLDERGLVQAIVNEELQMDDPNITWDLPIPTNEEIPAFPDPTRALTTLSRDIRMLWQRVATGTRHHDRAVCAVTAISFQAAYNVLAHSRREAEGADDSDDLTDDDEWIERTVSNILRNAIALGLSLEDHDRNSEICRYLDRKHRRLLRNQRERMFGPEIDELQLLANALRQRPRPESIQLPYTAHLTNLRYMEIDSLRERFSRVENRTKFVDFVALTIQDTMDRIHESLADVRRGGDVISPIEHSGTAMSLLKGLCEVLEAAYGKIAVADLDSDHPLAGLPPEARSQYAVLREIFGSAFTPDEMQTCLADRKKIDALVKTLGPEQALQIWEAQQRTSTQRTGGPKRSQRLSKAERQRRKKQREREVRRRKRGKKRRGNDGSADETQ